MANVFLLFFLYRLRGMGLRYVELFLDSGPVGKPNYKTEPEANYKTEPEATGNLKLRRSPHSFD